MPLPIMLAHRLVRRLTDERQNGELAFLRPDGKSQVTIEYEGGKPTRVDAVVVSTQHDPVGGPTLASQAELRARVKESIIDRVVPAHMTDGRTRYHINPTGQFEIGGPHGDTGPDRPQDHRGHLRRDGPPRRRRVLGQGSHEG